jgi:hypothetical protein
LTIHRSVIDAIFEPKAAIYQAARAVAELLELPDDWLNDAVKAFAPGDDPDGRVIFRTPHLQVTSASPEYLLAMKLLAARVDRDTEDIRTLYEILGFSTADEGLDLIERFYPRAEIAAKTQFLLEEMFGPTRPHRENRARAVDESAEGRSAGPSMPE